MKKIEKTVFISYRRTNFPWALAIYQKLTGNGYDVFIDYTSIDSGDFEQIILGNINSRAHFLVLLTPSALERCSEPGDWLRREIEFALDTHRNIVPLMFEGFDFSNPSIKNHLTGKLAVMSRYNALPVPSEYFDAAMDRLSQRFLNVPLEMVVHPPSVEAEQSARQQQIAANEAPTVKEESLTAQEWLEKGFALNDNSEEELNCYNEAILLDPEYALAYNNRGAVRKAHGDLEGALQDYDRSIKLENPQLHLPYYNRGSILSDQGDLESARRAYDTAIRIRPDYSPVYINRGNLRKAQGDLEGALLDFNRAIELEDPELHLPYYNRGSLLDDQGDLEGALRDYSEAIRIKPDYALAYNNRGILRSAQGDLDGALSDYNRAIEYDNPELHLTFNNRGLVLQENGDLEGAMSDFNQAIHIEPEYALAYNNRGILRDAMGDQDGALSDYNRAIELNLPSLHLPYFNRGNLFRAQGELDAALHEYNEAIRLKPDYVNAYYNCAMVNEAQGNLEGAVQNYQTYLDLGGGIQDGDQEEVEGFIQNLKKKIEE